MQLPSRNDLLQAQLEKQKKSAASSTKTREREKEAGYLRVSVKVLDSRKELLLGIFKGIATILDGEQNGELDQGQAIGEPVKLIRRKMGDTGQVPDAQQAPAPVGTLTTGTVAPMQDDDAEEV